jgi:SAM-dependent methyltransferase
MHPWEREYRNPQFITLGTEPLADVRDFMRWLKKYLRKEEVEDQDLTTWTGLDVGCGNGKNIKYLVDSYIYQGIGYDISTTAIALAKKLQESSNITYEVRSIGETLPLKEGSVDLVLDNTSSHALNEKERKVYLAEMVRVLRPGGFFMIRTLCLDGDTNAKNLIKQFPAGEFNTYELAATGMREHVFTEKDFRDFYGESFTLLFLKKTSGYQKWGNQSYKRNYLIAYLQKK